MSINHGRTVYWLRWSRKSCRLYIFAPPYPLVHRYRHIQNRIPKKINVKKEFICTSSLGNNICGKWVSIIQPICIMNLIKSFLHISKLNTGTVIYWFPLTGIFDSSTQKCLAYIWHFEVMDSWNSSSTRRWLQKGVRSGRMRQRMFCHILLFSYIWTSTNTPKINAASASIFWWTISGVHALLKTTWKMLNWQYLQNRAFENVFLILWRCIFEDQ